MMPERTSGSIDSTNQSATFAKTRPRTLYELSGNPAKNLSDVADRLHDRLRMGVAAVLRCRVLGGSAGDSVLAVLSQDADENEPARESGGDHDVAAVSDRGRVAADADFDF